MWLADTSLCKIHKLDLDEGTVLDEIDVTAPEVPGITVQGDRIWFACAVTRRICSVVISE
jgi:hypothetical protein